jgi:hypothetical protein
MKRTRQVFHYNEDAVPSDISGCRMFHGEDLRKFLNHKYSSPFHKRKIFPHTYYSLAFQDRMK